MQATNVRWAHCLWHERLRCIYAIVPKAGTTSIKRWYVTTSPEWAAEFDGKNVHDFLRERCTMERLPRPRAEQLLADPGVFRFSFVRNPWTRLVSGYLDKVVGVEPTARSAIRAGHCQTWGGWLAWRLRKLLGGEATLYRQGLTFRQFVAAIASQPLSEINPHFAPQSHLLAHVPLDFVGRVEQFNSDFDRVLNRLGESTTAQAAHQRQYDPGESSECVADWPAPEFRGRDRAPHWRRFYTNEVAAIVREQFAEDFARFDYSPNLPPLSAPRCAA